MRILSVCALMDAETGGGNAERVLQLSKAFLMTGATATGAGGARGGGRTE